MKLEQVFISQVMDDLAHNRLELPSLPEVAIRIKRTVDNPDSTTTQLAKVISSDAGLSARLFKIVNGPLYRTDHPVTDMNSVVTRLGRNLIRTLASSMLMQQIYNSKSTTAITPHLKKLWNHSTKVATLSYVFAKHFTQLNQHEAMLAGLLHDIGIIPVLVKAAKYPELLKNSEMLDNVVRHLHTITGPLIMDAWGFQPEMIKVAAEHENIDRTDSTTITFLDIVILANLHSYLGTQHPYTKVDWTTLPSFKKLGLTPETSLRTLDEARDEQNEILRMLTD